MITTICSNATVAGRFLAIFIRISSLLLWSIIWSEAVEGNDQNIAAATLSEISVVDLDFGPPGNLVIFLVSFRAWYALEFLAPVN